MTPIHNFVTKRTLNILCITRQLCNVVNTSTANLELGVKYLLTGKLGEIKRMVPANATDPGQKSLLSNAYLLSGDLDNAELLSNQVIQHFKQTGVSSDSYMDFSGALNDLAVIYFEKGDTEGAERQLRRALLMAERSYRLSFDLQSSICANLISINSASESGTKAEQLNDQLLELLKTPRAQLTQENFLQPSSYTTSSTLFPHALSVFPALRRCQVYYTVGCTLGIKSKQFAYGISFINRALELLSCLPSEVVAAQCKKFLYQLANFQEICFMRTGSYAKTHHLQRDGLEMLCKTMYSTSRNVLRIDSATPSLLRDLGEIQHLRADSAVLALKLNPAPALGVLLSCPDCYNEEELFISNS